MNIIMCSLEHSSVPIEIREVFSFTQKKVSKLDNKIADIDNVNGCVIVSTCNRTELYISANTDINPVKELCKAANINYSKYKEHFEIYDSEKAVHHLMEVTAGLRSRVFGEDQIISQVRQAIILARQSKATDSILETLFRNAVTAGKEIRSNIHLTAVSSSAAEDAINIIDKKTRGLKGKSVLIIGNGEMGRTASKILLKNGCTVTITLRSYHHGETIVPAGCNVIDYEKRFEYMNNVDILISATASPHYTITEKDMSTIKNPPIYLVDLAVPRDIQPEVGNISGITLYNIDQLGTKIKTEIPPQVDEIITKQEQSFYRWLNYRNSIPASRELKENIIRRIITDRLLEEELDLTEVVELSVDKTVDLIMGSIDINITPMELSRCSEKIQAHTTTKPIVLCDQNKKG